MSRKKSARPGIQFAEPEFYHELGLICGIEMHRQLNTNHKLFCKCPVLPYSDEYHAVILRHMRPTLSELGEYDPTALMEFKTKKEIFYRLNRDTVCTYEIDDAPPFGLNREAMEKALVVAMMLNLSLVNELHIARKQYLDGSIPTGFQRTTILGVDGHLMCEGKRIGVQQLGLEEDSCREVSDQGHRRTYTTDRLSIPLIEIVTNADMRTPAEAAKVANVIRRISHLSGVCRTGHGRARQDVNVSIAGGSRAEIKGVSSIREIPALVHFEALRQKALLEIRDRYLNLNLTDEDFAWTADVTDMVRRHPHPAFAGRFAGHAGAMAIVLRRSAGLLAYPTGPGRVFGDEFSDRLRIVACLDKMPNMAHSDDPGSFQYVDLFDRIRKMASAGANDVVVVVAGPTKDVETAIGEIRLRMREAGEGVPRETRRSLRNGGTRFERVLPGPGRMYPDTDLPPIVLTENDFETARGRAPQPLWDKEDAYLSAGLSREQTYRLFYTDAYRLFDQVVDQVGLRPSILAYLLLDFVPSLVGRGVDVAAMDTNMLLGLFPKGTEYTQKDAAAAVAKALGHDVHWVMKTIDRRAGK